MIFARDKSQMCNNLLQYAHVYAWGREHGQNVISMRFSYKYQYFHICHTSLTGFGWYLFAKYMAALHLLPTISFKEADCDRQVLEQKKLHHRETKKQQLLKNQTQTQSRSHSSSSWETKKTA